MQCACSVLHCFLSPPWIYHVFHYSINGRILGVGELWNLKYVFWFSLQFLSKIFLSRRRFERDIVINVNRSSCKVCDILVRLYWNFKFSGYIFDKSSNIKFNENPFSGSRVVPTWAERQMDGRTDNTKLLVALHNFANKPNEMQFAKWIRVLWLCLDVHRNESYSCPDHVMPVTVTNSHSFTLMLQAIATHSYCHKTYNINDINVKIIIRKLLCHILILHT
jgi:hypothetical protein